MAVFDIDMTLLDNEQRYKDAKRAGIIDKDGKPKRKTKFETPGKAFKRAQEFLFDSARLQKDKLIPGAADFVNSLVEQGYIIAYCTARRLTFYEVTKRQLENKGFPLMMDDTGRELLFMKSGGSDTSAKYKQKVITQLNSSYDVRFFFDDMIENLQAVAQVGVPGLYPSIKAYTDLSAKSNPYREASADDFFPGPAKVAPYYMTAQTIPITALQNPPVKPRRKKMKNGKYRKEPAKKYIDRFMGNSKMVSEFPDRGQRYAVSLQYVEKFYGKRGLDSVGARQNPEEYSEDYMVPRDIHRLGKAADRLEGTYEDGQEVPEWWKSKMSVAARDADTLADALDYVAQNPSDCPPATQSLELNTKNRNNAIQSDYIRYGPLNLNDSRYYDDAAAHWNTDVATAKKSKCSNCVAFDISPRMLECMPGPVSQPIEDEEGYLGYCWMHHFKCHSARTCYTWAAGGPIKKDKVSMEWQDRAFGKEKKAVEPRREVAMANPRSNPRKNPSHEKKIEKGKKLYKHMNGKEPEKITKQKIDVGDVWYQVGEGGCWQIGYMSGKETGSSNQKYTHTFNEETQDGNFPKLYATMPESGKPLLIIQGGTWKIKTDDKGVAWIYD